MDDLEFLYKSKINDLTFDKDETTQSSHRELCEEYLNLLVDKIFNTNEAFCELKNKVIVVSTKDDPSRTLTIKSASEHIILLDLYTQDFLWKMNKCFFYGNPAGQETCIKLYMEYLLYFLSISEEYSNPNITIINHIPELEYSLLMATQIQETFILAHEMAHIHCNHIKNRDDLCIDCSTENEYRLSFPQIYNADEHNADNFAFDAVLNAFNAKENRANYIQVINSIWLMLRSYFCLSMLKDCKEGTTKGFEFWISRKHHFQDLFIENNKWGDLKRFEITELILDITLGVALIRLLEEQKEKFVDISDDAEGIF